MYILGNSISYLLLKNKLPQYLVAWNNNLLLSQTVSMGQEFKECRAEMGHHHSTVSGAWATRLKGQLQQLSENWWFCHVLAYWCWCQLRVYQKLLTGTLSCGPLHVTWVFSQCGSWVLRASTLRKLACQAETISF